MHCTSLNQSKNTDGQARMARKSRSTITFRPALPFILTTYYAFCKTLTDLQKLSS